MGQPIYQIVTIENGKFIIMKDYQSIATFRISKAGKLIVSYFQSYNKLSIEDKNLLNTQIYNSIKL